MIETSSNLFKVTEHQRRIHVFEDMYMFLAQY